MNIYQADYRQVTLPRPAQLLISSVPIEILLGPKAFLHWLKESMATDSITIIDAPQCFNLNIEGWKTCWEKEIHDFYYTSNVQVLRCFSTRDVEKPPVIPYRTHSQRQMQHECEFDNELIEFLIQTFSAEGDIVVDPFCGTGTVPRTARDLNRVGIGIDQRCPFTNEL